MLERQDLLPYQNYGIEFFKTRPNAAAWMFMGAGKTVMAETAYLDMRNSFAATRLLAIGPKRVAKRVWSDELKEWKHLNDLSISRIVGSEDECFDALRQKADIHTIGRERVPWLRAQFLEGRGKSGKLKFRWPWDTVAIDESQSFKSQGSQRWDALNELRPYFPRMWQLSGTPAPNGYGNLWAPFYLLDRGKRLETSENKFKQRWFTPPEGMFAKWNLSKAGEVQIRDAIKDLVLSFRESDYLQLPEVFVNFIRVSLSPAAMYTYKQMEKEYIAEIGSKKLTAVNAGVLDGKLLQMSNGAAYYEGKNWVEFHSAKIEALEETLEGIPGKVLICYGFNHDKSRIATSLDRLSINEGKTWRVLNSDRDFEEWAEGKIDWGLLHPASAGHGLNSVYQAGAEDLIWFGLTNNLEYYQQACARLTGGHRRAGKNIRIHHLVADGTRDDDYVRLIKRKALTQDELANSLATRIR